jgi:hypothetical protein
MKRRVGRDIRVCMALVLEGGGKRGQAHDLGADLSGHEFI